MIPKLRFEERMIEQFESTSLAVAEPSSHWLNRTVLGTGVTSAFSDLTYETNECHLARLSNGSRPAICYSGDDRGAG
jgi:hypothetical protein